MKTLFSKVDFKKIFECSPEPQIVLKPDLTALAVNDAFLHLTRMTRDEVIGRSIYEISPRFFTKEEQGRISELRQSLERVLKSHDPDTIAVKMGTGYARLISKPLLSKNKKLSLILHAVENMGNRSHEECGA